MWVRVSRERAVAQLGAGIQDAGEDHGGGQGPVARGAAVQEPDRGGGPFPARRRRGRGAGKDGEGVAEGGQRDPALEQDAEPLDQIVPLRQVGEGGFLTLASEGLAQQGGRGAPVGHAFDIHGYYNNYYNEMASLHYMGTPDTTTIPPKHPPANAQEARIPLEVGASRHGFEITLFVLALVYGFGARGLTASGDPGVALVPIGLAAALALLSAGIAFSEWRKQRRGRGSDTNRSEPDSSPAAEPDPVESAAATAQQPDRGSEAKAGPGEVHFLQRPGSARAWSVVGLTILYAALFQTLGYVLATLLYTAAVAERFGARRRTILVLTPCVTLLIFVLFRVILGARLPGGLLG